MNTRTIHLSTSLALAVLLALVGLLAAPAAHAKSGPSGDGPGNSPNAMACHKSGWEDLQGTDGTQFANEEDCVAHAARGGELEPKDTTPTFNDWAVACEEAGGNSDINDPGTQWQCTGDLRVWDPLEPICGDAGGQFRVLSEDTVTCDLF